MASSSATGAEHLGDLLIRSTSQRINLAARRRLGQETPSNKRFRYALQTTGALLALAALAVFFAWPLHGGILAVPLLIAGLLLVWLQS